MKLLSLIFIASIIWLPEARANDQFLWERARRSSKLSGRRSNANFFSPPFSPDRSSKDCLLCYHRPCTTCPKAQLNFMEQCPPCTSPPCPPCSQSPEAFLYRRSKEGQPFFPSAGKEPVETLLELFSDDCTLEATDDGTEELVQGAAALLPFLCFLYRYSFLPPSGMIDTLCQLRGEKAVSFIRQHLRELTEYLKQSLLPDFSSRGRKWDSDLVIPRSGSTPSGPFALGQTTKSSLDSSDSVGGQQEQELEQPTLKLNSSESEAPLGHAPKNPK